MSRKTNINTYYIKILVFNTTNNNNNTKVDCV